MGRTVAQVPVVAVLMALVMVVAVLISISGITQAIKAISVVIINNPVREISNSNLGIRVTQSC